MTIITVRDEAHWHELRQSHIGGSEVAALFGLSPHTSKWQLWMEKSGKLPPENLDDNKSVQAGKFLEAGIAGWAASKWGMSITKVNDYHKCDSVVGMGASLDYINDEGDPVEIKWSARGHGWEYSGDDIIAAPENYVIQVQHQIACVNAKGAWLVALVNNEPRRMWVPRNETIIEAISSACVEFWFSIMEATPPEPDFSMDSDAIVRLIDGAPITDIALGPEYEGLFDAYLKASADEKAASAAKDAAKGELLLLLEEKARGTNTTADKAVVKCGERKMTVTKIAPNPGKIVTEEMLGTYIGARKGYPLVRIS